MFCRPLVSQKRDFSSVSVSCTPLCITRWWQSQIMSPVIWWSEGNHAGSLAASGREELQSLPLHLKIPFSSLITPSWMHCWLNFSLSGIIFCDSFIHSSLLDGISSLARLPQFAGPTEFEVLALAFFKKRMTRRHSAQLDEVTVIFTVNDKWYANFWSISHEDWSWILEVWWWLIHFSHIFSLDSRAMVRARD